MQSLKPISIDLMQRGVYPVIDAKQNDSDTRGIIASVYNGSVPFFVPSGATAIFRYKKPDGTAGFYDTLEDNSTPAVTVSGNAVTVMFAEQVLAVAGLVQGEINFYTSAGERLTSFTLSIQVQASVLSDAVIISRNYCNVLTAQVAQTLEYKNAAAQSAQSAAASAALAQQISQQGKGWFATDTALKQAFPTGQNGWWAIVGASDNVWTWDADTSAWVNTHQQTDLSNYYTKPQSDNTFSRKAEYANFSGGAVARDGCSYPCNVFSVKSNGKIDFHIDIGIEQNAGSNSIYEAVSMAFLKNGMGVSTLSWSPSRQSRVILYPHGATVIENLYMGRTGLKFTKEGHIARCYDADLELTGGWATNTPVFTVGNYLHIDVWGADYT